MPIIHITKGLKKYMKIKTICHLDPVRKFSFTNFVCCSQLKEVLFFLSSLSPFAVPPELPYPRIVPMIPDSDGGQPINLTCRADRGSIGLTKLYWMNNDTMHIQQEMISYPNADGTTENVTSVIEAYPSEKPYTCVATLNTSGHENAMASINIRPLHLSTPITPTPTVTTTRQNETTTDDTGSVNSRPNAWKIAVGGQNIGH